MMVPSMLPSEKLELAICKYVNSLGMLPADVSLPRLSQILGEANHARIAECLSGLEAENRISLHKWSGGAQRPRNQFRNDAEFFYSGSFLIKIAPLGRKYFEELEQRAGLETKERSVAINDSLIFVSCGQSTPAERQLGQTVAGIIERETGCRAYFAEDQTSLEGLTENILKRLQRAVGFIAIMHPRGNVSNPNNPGQSPWVRGSVWVEQEIAIAAFISQALQSPIRVRAYVHESIRREGIRDQLMLNPKIFRDESEILSDLALLLPSWRDLAQQATSGSVVSKGEHSRST